MALPDSGSLSLKTAAGEGRSIAQEVDGNTTGNKSLTTLSVTAGKSAPHAMSEFYGYPPLEPPGVPQNVVATRDGDDIVVTWDPPSSGGEVSSYELFYTEDGGSSNYIGIESSPFIHDQSELTLDVTYQYLVYAANASGTSSEGVSNSLLYN